MPSRNTRTAKNVPSMNSTCHAAATAMASSTVDSSLHVLVFGTETLLEYVGETRGCMLGARVQGCGISAGVWGPVQFTHPVTSVHCSIGFRGTIHAGFGSAHVASPLIEKTRACGACGLRAARSSEAPGGKKVDSSGARLHWRWVYHPFPDPGSGHPLGAGSCGRLAHAACLVTYRDARLDPLATGTQRGFVNSHH